MRLILESSSGVRIRCELKRHLSPATVGLIARSLPISGNMHRLGTSIVYLETGLQSGVERPRGTFRRGDIAFYPQAGSVCFVASDVAPAQEMSPLGRMVDYADELGSLAAGDVLTLLTAA